MKVLLPLLLTALLTACGGSENKQTIPFTELPQTNLSALTLVDASGRPLENATVAITKQTSGIAALSSIQSNLVTDAKGNLVLNNLQPGIYQLSIMIGDITVTSSIEIAANNASESAVVPAPVNFVNDEYIELDADTILVALNGTVYSAQGLEAGAEVSMSGGSVTNGAIASDITNDQGRYSLILNIGTTSINPDDLKNASLRVVKDGFIEITKNFDISKTTSLIGLNIALTADKKSADVVVYSDDFNTSNSGATCGAWKATNNWDIYAGGISSQTSEAGWHAHSSNLNIRNQAVANELVQLAPDDASKGNVPNPVSGKACWYGQAQAGLGQGNFLGILTEDNSGGSKNEGGTSDYEHAGILTSPALNFAKEKGPLSLTFKTFWEIESVNPNDDGFDLMLIEISTDNGATWTNIARLNPLSDPTYGDDDLRAPMPFSNRGFNRAPAWLWQEPIDISDLAGVQNARIRFVFSTEDQLYNGFRGWLIDDVQVIRKKGTFPHYTGPFLDFCEELDYCDDYAPFTTSNANKVRPRPQRNMPKSIAR